jgi:haloacetate dehalogenase
MFDGFDTLDVDTGEVRIHARRAGSGPPLLLLHGYPQTHVIWHEIAPALAEDFTVVAADLRGYGGSDKPPTTPDHWPYSKRAMARDQIGLMHALGFDRFHLCGHDRGARVGYRMALDHPERVDRLAVIDIVPTGEAIARANREFGLGYWHWFFLAQPAPLPERLIAADPDAYYTHFNADFFDPEAVAAYRRNGEDPAAINAMCEDYRAAMTLDYAHDLADRNMDRRIASPLLALWGGRWHLEDWYDVLAIWRDWAAGDVTGRALDSGHYVVEERPDETLAELRAFFGA